MNERQSPEPDRAEWAKMVAGELYLAADPYLTAMRRRARLLLKKFNDASEDELDVREATLRELFGAAGPGLYIEPPFFCDYGTNLTLGTNVYFNTGCVVLDVAPVTIGDRVMFAPGVHVYTAGHPLDPVERASGREWGRAVAIGDDVWLGGRAVICPGVTIGPRSVIGAGSVVVKDVPADVVAAGNPARVIRRLRAE